MDKLWIIVQIIPSSFGLIYILTLSKWRFSQRATLITAAAFIIGTTAMNYFFVQEMSYLLKPYPFLDFVYRIFNVALVVAIFNILVRQSWTHSLFIILSSCGCVLIVDTLSITIRMQFGAYPPVLLFELLLYPAMTYVIFHLRKPFWEVSEYMGKKLLPLSLVPACFTFCFFIQVSLPTPLDQNPRNVPVALILCGVSIIIYGVIFYLTRIVCAKGAIERNLLAIRLYTSSLEHINHMNAQKIKSDALIRHDFRHVTNMAALCLDSGDIDGARSLLVGAGQSGAVSGGSGIARITGYKILDTALSYFMGLAHEAGIQLSLNIDGMDDLAVDKSEFAVVISNAFENAINACVKAEADAPGVLREIHINCGWRGKQYFVEMGNTCLGAVDFDPESGLPKSNAEGHGLGVQSIAYFARSNNALLQYIYEDNWFTMRMLI